MGRPRIPLSAYERGQLRKATLVVAGLLVLCIPIVGFAATRGDTRIVVSVLVIAGLSFAGMQLTRLRKPWLSGLVLAGVWVAIGALFGHPGFGLVLGIAFFAFLAIETARRSRLDPDNLQPLDSSAVDPEATGQVAAFEKLGFEQTAALSLEIPGRTLIETLMIGPRGDEYAAVTSLAMDVNSTFGPRILVTANHAATSPVPEALRNDLRGADPAELVAAHRRALEILAARGLRPDPIDRERVLEVQIALERRSIEWAMDGFGRRLAQTFFGSGTGLGFGPLDESAESQRRIDDWLGVALAES